MHLVHKCTVSNVSTAYTQMPCMVAECIIIMYCMKGRPMGAIQISIIAPPNYVLIELDWNL